MVRLRRSLQPLLLSGAAILLSLGAPPVKSQVPAPRDAGRPVTAPATCAEPVARLISYQGTLNIRRTGVTPAAATLDDSFCPGDVLEVGPWSRAALQLADQTVVRVDADTVLSFTAPRDDKRTWLDILRGIIHVISRDPRDLRITTPYADAGIEGTEFLVQVADGATTVVVFEGLVLVSNGQGSVSAGSGESAVARQGSAPVLRQAVRSRDSVVWTLYYPPVTSGGRPAPDAAPLADAGVAFYLGRAEARLARGRAGEAAADLDAALAMAPGSGEVLARQSVMALTRGEADTAARLADDAVAAAPASASAWLAQSYLQQSRGELPAALASLETAAASEPGNALVQARLAELRLSLGDVDGAESAARSAAAADPGLSLAPVVLGFVELARVNLAAAEAAFRQAIALESHAPLAHLGLGLTRIRAGDLAEGRESLEHAVILDPGDALVRSYVGKAYYEERRDELAGSQFAQAKALDPQDPTPWFYDAIRRQAGNDPVGALEDIQASIDRNDNRMAYRSRLTLDRDEAARSAGLGRIFSDLGFDQLALREGWKSVG
jgi:tetratricopeptide (TPR) repeat protein